VTEVLDWRAIFLVQAPVVAAAGLICRSAASAGTAPRHTTSRHPRRADETLVTAVNGAFAPAFLICGALALLGAAGLLVSTRARLRAALASCAVACALVPTQAAIATATKPDPVVIAYPCEVRSAPSGGGLGGLLQGRALGLLDEAACALGTSREKLALDILEGKSPPLQGILDGELLSLGDILDGELPSLWRLLERLIAP
jgi:hypothetical protein